MLTGNNFNLSVVGSNVCSRDTKRSTQVRADNIARRVTQITCLYFGHIPACAQLKRAQFGQTNTVGSCFKS